MNTSEEHTCYCTECWEVRPECTCTSGPTGQPSSSCPACITTYYETKEDS